MPEPHKPPQADHGDATLMLVTFACRRGRVGVEARHVRRSRRAGEAESLSEIPRLDALLGLDSLARMQQPTCLVVDSGEGLTEVLVEGPVELIALPAHQVFPLPPLIAETSKVHGLRALGLTDQGVLLLIGLSLPGGWMATERDAARRL